MVDRVRKGGDLHAAALWAAGLISIGLTWFLISSIISVVGVVQDWAADEVEQRVSLPWGSAAMEVAPEPSAPAFDDWLTGKGGLQAGLGGSLGEAGTRELLLGTGWAPEHVRTALCIVNWESGFNPSAYNPNDGYGGSHGLFQINGWWSGSGVPLGFPKFDVERAYDAEYNSWYALRIFAVSGWAPWASWEHCGG